MIERNTNEINTMQVQQVQQYQHKPVWSLVHCWVLQHKIFAYNIGTHSLVLCQHLRTNSHLLFISHIKAWPPFTCCSIVMLVCIHLLFISYIKIQVGLILYLVAFQSGVGPVPWVYNPEVNPNFYEIRNNFLLMWIWVMGSILSSKTS